MSDDKLALAFEDIIDAVSKFVCDTTRIVCANGFDLLELDMKDFDRNVYFISYPWLERGKFYEIIDEDLKLQLYEFCIKNPDRVFQGEK
jgi:hypothetical protein